MGRWTRGVVQVERWRRGGRRGAGMTKTIGGDGGGGWGDVGNRRWVGGEGGGGGGAVGEWSVS